MSGMTDERREEIEDWLAWMSKHVPKSENANLARECLEEIDRLKGCLQGTEAYLYGEHEARSLRDEIDRLKDQQRSFGKWMVERQILKEENRKLREEIDRLNTAGERIASELRNSRGAYELLTDECDYYKEENRKARELLKRCSYSGDLEKEVLAFLKREES